MSVTSLPPEAQTVPGESAVARTSSATAFATCRGFHSNTSETITVTMADGTSVDLAVSAGSLYPYKIKAYTAGSGGIVTIY